MAIIMRNGLEADFDPNKMRAGELAIVTDARELHATFAPGDSPKVLLDGEAVPNPETAGTEGQVLALDENGDPEWKSVAAPSDAQVEAAVTDWLDEHPEATTTVEDGAITYAKLDSNLKGTVDDVGELKSDLSELAEEVEAHSGLSDEAKEALLACFAKVAWIDEHGQDYYDTLESALYPSEYPKIVAVFNSGQNTIYTDDTLDSLKQYLTVTYFETEESTGTVVPSANYTLSGTLVVGASTIIVVYNNLTTSFKINNVVNFYNIVTWSTSDLLSVNIGNIVTELFPEIVSNTGTTNRAIVTCPHGKKEILQYNNNNPIPFSPSRYPIPIPVGATSVTIQYSGTSARPILNVFGYANDQYTKLNEYNTSEWIYNKTFTISETGQNLFAVFLLVIGANNPPTGITIEYGFD